MERATHRLIGRVSLVTGASSGLGRATALALAAAGADVALVARPSADLEAVAEQVGATGRRSVVAAADLANARDIRRAVAKTMSVLGRVDVLVNVAATDAPGPVERLEIADWDRVLAVNLRAPFLLAKLVLQGMRSAGSGTIVNVSSVAGKRGWANAAAYCASKFGLTGLTQVLAAEGRQDGIRVCAIYPGGMATNWGVWDSAGGRGAVATEQTPSTRAMSPADIADLVVWIASAPSELVLNEVIVTPLAEAAWP